MPLRLLAYFRWLAEILRERLPDSLFTRMLLYAANADGDLDVEGLYRSVGSNPDLEKQTMTLAEQLIAQGHVSGLQKGREEGREEGQWIGRIQALEEFLGKPQSSGQALGSRSVEELMALHRALHGEYEARFKRP